MDECGLLPRYSGNPVGLQGEGLSCDQFCAIVESQIETFKWSENEAFSHAVQAFTSPAMEWAFNIKDFNTWTQLKSAMKAKFMGKMTIQMKAELRKSLKQSLEESVNDFYSRCKEAEKLICDELIGNVEGLGITAFSVGDIEKYPIVQVVDSEKPKF